MVKKGELRNLELMTEVYPHLFIIVGELTAESENIYKRSFKIIISLHT